MPSITFVLPHWLYWLGLACFPIVALVLAQRTFGGDRNNPYGIFVAYFIWFCGGFLGLHRFYLRKISGFLFCVLFGCILYSSQQENLARIDLSDTRAEVQALQASIERGQAQLRREGDKAQNLQAELQDLEADSSVHRRTERAYNRAVKNRDQAGERITRAGENLQTARPKMIAAEALQKTWGRNAFIVFVAALLLMLYDAVRMGHWIRQANDKYRPEVEEIAVASEVKEDASFVHPTGWLKRLDLLSLYSGYFVAYWSVIAVFVYYYEVFMRYVFNSPTNWAHEAMFLMFGMQYLVAGSYAYLTESHVRVDIFYAKLSPRGKAFVDVLTSVFFFIFATTLIWTSLTFAIDSTAQGEVSFTEWAIQYWPVKIVMVLGAGLLLLQGVSKLFKDIGLLMVGNRAGAR